jgi:hypothetical protein
MAQETYQRLPSLERLNRLVGEWNLEFIFPMDPDHHLHGREDFEWMKDGTFLFERWHVAHPDATDRVGIIGANDDGETFTMHSFGSSGVTRVYSMSLNDGVWKLWHDDPGLPSASRESSVKMATALRVTGKDRRMAQAGNATLTCFITVSRP